MSIKIAKQTGNERDKRQRKHGKPAVPDIRAAKRIGAKLAGLSEPPNTIVHSAEEA